MLKTFQPHQVNNYFCFRFPHGASIRAEELEDKELLTRVQIVPLDRNFNPQWECVGAVKCESKPLRAAGLQTQRVDVRKYSRQFPESTHR